MIPANHLHPERSTDMRNVTPPRKTVRRAASRLMPAALSMLATLMALPVQAVVDIPKIPLQSTNPVPPNIMFILDDSGSMQWEAMPDALVATEYLFPRPLLLYGGDTYGNNVLEFDDNYLVAVRRRSPDVNAIFYNPAVDYLPWATYTGAEMADAPVTAAPYNPALPAVGTLNLTVEQTQYANWRESDGDNVQKFHSFYPITFYMLKTAGADNVVRTNYYRYQYRGGTLYQKDLATNTEVSVGATVTWGTKSRTIAAEIQNFANWFTYYRSRMLAARAGIGRAFSQLPPSTLSTPAPRVGFSAINKGSTTVDNEATRAVITGVRTFDSGNRQAFFDNLYGHVVGNGNTPLRRALDDVGQYISRTDNYGPWATTPGTNDTTTQLSCRKNFSILMTDGYWTEGDSYNAGGARNDNNDGTAGSAITNPSGSVTYTYSPVSPFTDDRADTLADVASYYWKTDLRSTLGNNVPTSDKNPAFWQHMVTFGVGLGVVGTLQPKDAFDAISSGATITWPDPTASQPAKIDDLLHAAVNSRGEFFSASNPKEFADGLVSILSSISQETASGSNVAANSVALKEETRIFQASFTPGSWTGELQSFKITSAGIAATPVWSASAGIPAHGSRKIFTWTGSAGATFPTGAQSTALTANVAAYIRGDGSLETKTGNGTFRNRPHLLGDIINSSPAYVKESGTIFIGSNNGMMHAFKVEGTGEGQELFAYVPNAVSTTALAKLKTLADSTYGHEYFVDGPVSVSSYLDTPNKNILVGSLGRGGKGLYFLDVTTPSSFATTNVIGEYLGTDGTSSATASNNLGYSIGRPLVANVVIGTTKTPVAIVANGLNSGTGDPALFIFNLTTGALLKVIVAKADSDNGLSTPRGWDADGDRLIDYVYAGDLKGNLWKFDLSSNKVADWDLATGGDPLFVATGPGGVAQPITGGISVAMNPTTFKPWVFFGTGKYLENGDLTSTATQTWYGLRDEGQITGAYRAGAATDVLQSRSLVASGIIDGTPARAFQANATLDPSKKGWYVDLPAPVTTPPTPAERMVGDPFLIGSVMVAASIVPSSDPCDAGGKGYINAIDAFTGTSVATPFFDIDGTGTDDDKLTSGGNSIPIGSVDLGIAMPTSPTVVESLLVAGGSSGQTGTVKVNNPLLKGRISWREIIRD